MKVKELCQDAVLLALLIVASKISFNIGTIPVTMQTLVVILIGYLANWKNVTLIYIAYLLMGLLGVPVFSGGGGFAYIFKPSFGFILGFMISGIIMSIYKGNNKLALAGLGVLGLLIIYTCGVLYMYLIINFYIGKNVDLMYAISAGVLPFWIKDLISVGISYMISLRLKKYLNRAEEPVNILA